MGSKSSGDSSAANAQAQLATQLAAEAGPLRNALLGNYAQSFGLTPIDTPAGNQPGQTLLERASGAPGIKDGGASAQQYAMPEGGLRYDPGRSPIFAAGRDVLNQQFQNAEQDIIASTAPGGALLDRLADNEVQQAISIGNLASGVTESELNRAIQLATGATSSAQSGFGSAAAAQAQQAQAEASQKAGLGQAAGTAYAGYKLGTGGVSDQRVKENLERIGTANNGLPIYVGNYLGSKRKQLFILAQDVEKSFPGAVREFNGFKLVEHGEIPWQEMV